MNSILTNTWDLIPRDLVILRSRTIGVFPIASVMSLAIAGMADIGILSPALSRN
jgi:hypothetical protein